jgi:alpha-L-rhamnosidase
MPTAKRNALVTDETWRGTESPIVSDSIYNGEVHDARLEMPGWNAPGFDASAWRAAALSDQPIDTLTAHIGPPIQVTEEIAPVAISELKPGVFIFDFGQNAAGRARLKVKGEAGTAVQIRHAEVLNPDGTLHTEILRGAKCTDTYILKGGGEEIWEPAFTYRGFRYAEVTGFPGTPTKDALTFRVMHANTPQIGEFTCSEDIINRVQKNIVWGARSNFYSVPTDCPQRDERLGWTGDMQLFLPAAAMNFDIAGYMTKWMQDIVDSRNADGSIPDVIPALSAAPGAPGWSDVVVTLPVEHAALLWRYPDRGREHRKRWRGTSISCAAWRRTGSSRAGAMATGWRWKTRPAICWRGPTSIFPHYA